MASHIADTNNPHAVTKDQVGLGSVDNTADLDKPVSTATQTALDAKANAADLPATIVASIVAGTNVTVDATDPANPVISALGGGGGGGAVDSVNGQTGIVSLDQDDIPDGATAKQFTATEQTKLAGIEAGADVTDAANVVASLNGASVPNDTIASTDRVIIQDASDSNKLKYATAASLTSVTPDDSIALGKLAYQDSGTIIGRSSPSVGTVSALTAADVRGIINVEAGATANSSNATLLNRANHTGTQTASTISDFNTASDARISAAAGASIAQLVGGLVPTSQIPTAALTTVQTAASQTAMLALTTQAGDVVVRTDQSKTYMHNGGSTGTMADFTELSTPADAVASVNGQTGIVVLGKSDVGPGNVDNTSDANKPVSTATQTALNAKVAGPASATDNAIARYDGTTGKVVQISSATISDSGLLTVAGIAAGGGIAATGPGVYTDTLSEITSGAGVTADGLNIKDGKLNTNDSVIESNITDGSVGPTKLATGAIKLGYATVTTTQSLANGATEDITGLSVTVTVPAGGRDVKITGKVSLSSSGGTGPADVLIREGSTILGGERISIATTSNAFSSTAVALVPAPSAGSHTYKLSAFVPRTGAAAFADSGQYRSFILVELV